MIIIFLIAVFIGIFIHEFAHYLAAKKVKCSIDTISIGFGKPIFKKKIKNVTYQLTPFLLGGYVKLKHEFDYSKSKYAFTNLPYRKKLFIILAGITTNIIFGTFFILLGLKLYNYNVWYIGYINVLLGIGNVIPFPALDGSYIFLVWLEKFYGKKKGYKIMKKIVGIGMVILMILNIICIPLLIWISIKR